MDNSSRHERRRTRPLLRVAAVILAAALLPAGTASAASLETFRHWDRSPEALFMTAEERAGWKKVRTDSAAEQFVAAYKARRGSGFDRELQRRIQLADRYLTTGSTPGSRTLRGQVMILCGPPTRIERAGGATVGQPENPLLAGVYTNAGPMGSRSTQPRVTPFVFTLRYTGPQVRERLGREELVVRIELDASGKEKFADDTVAKEFERLSHRLAEWSVVPKDEGAIRIADFH